MRLLAQVKDRHMLKLALPLLVLAAGSAFAQPQQPTPREACKPDYDKLCQPGDKPRECFMAHKDQLSDVCKAAIVRARAARQAEKSGAPNPN
jgi:hypothetical protein